MLLPGLFCKLGLLGFPYLVCFRPPQLYSGWTVQAHSSSQTPLPAFRKALRFRPVTAFFSVLNLILLPAADTGTAA